MMGQNWIHINSRDGEARDTLANYQKALNVLKWNPTFHLKNWLQKMQINNNGDLHHA